jgi:hypothetical protein
MHTHRLQRTDVIRLCWVDDQQQQEIAAQAAEIDISPAADRLKCREGPSPNLTPLEVVELMLGAFQRGTNQDIEELFAFVDPNGDLAMEHAMSSAGPMAKFRWTIRKEPRWKNIARRPQAALLHMRDWQVLGHLGTDVDVRLYRVRAQPYFPDAPHAESDVIFQWKLTRHVSKGTHPDVLAALGSLADCWLVNSIEPLYGEWEVKDRLCAERCPDTFIMPKRGPPAEGELD